MPTMSRHTHREKEAQIKEVTRKIILIWNRFLCIHIFNLYGLFILGARVRERFRLNSECQIKKQEEENKKGPRDSTIERKSFGRNVLLRNNPKCKNECRQQGRPKTSNWKMSWKKKYSKPIEPMSVYNVHALICASPKSQQNQQNNRRVWTEKCNIIIWNRKYLNFRFTHNEREQSSIGSRLPLLHAAAVAAAPQRNRARVQISCILHNTHIWYTRSAWLKIKRARRQAKERESELLLV